MITLEQLEQDPYAALGVRKVINATCHWTFFGGTLVPGTSLRAMRAAAEHAVDVRELQRAAGRVVARYTHAEDGYVVSGCAAAMLAGAAAILTGTDRAKMQQLPDTTGMKDLCIAKRFPRKATPDGVEYVDHEYAIAVKTVGFRFAEIGEGGVATEEEYEAAFSSDVALVYWIGYAPPGDLPLRDVIRIAHSHDVPLLVDASNSLPPRENLHHFIDLGADLVCFSGGKGLQGPQGSGIIAGRADLIEAVSIQSAPSHGIGRVLKVSKEEIVAQIASLIWWAEQDEEERMTEHHRKSHLLADIVQTLPGVKVEVVFPDHFQRPYPTVHVVLSPGAGLAGADLRTALLDADPSIAAMSHPFDPAATRFDVRLLRDDEIRTIGRRLTEILKSV